MKPVLEPASEQAFQDAGLGLTSARLRLRRFVSADLDLLDRLNGDPQVMRYLGGPASRADTQAMLENRILRYYDAHPGLGVWATLERDRGDCIGFHLLNHIRGETHIQVGYRLFPEHWNKGYATEMSVALLRYAFSQRGLGRVTAITELGNQASQHVLTKSGLRRDGERHLADPAYARSNPVAWFERDAADWLAEDAHR